MCTYSYAASEATVKVALIADKASDLHKSPLLSLLEVKLSQRNDVQLLERTEVNKLLEEQRLGLLFSAKGVSERVTVGKLLQADLLVLIQAKEKNQVRYLSIIVAETEGGLRLLFRAISWSDNPLNDIDIINGLISQALDKYKGGIREICAVPPFVSNDLSHRYDYLQAVYARLMEQTILQYEGMVVVEIEEAHAIAQELTLAGETLAVNRNLPLYILGEYRNDRINNERRVSLKLTLQRGQEQLKAINRENLPPGEVAQFLREQSQELLKMSGQEAKLLSDPGIEARLLTQRADEFMSIAAWKEALTLLEASLLLNPDQPALHYNAVYALARLTRLHYDPYGDVDNFTQKAAIGLNYYELGLGHLGSFLRSTKIESRKHMNFVSDFWAAASYIQGYSRSSPEIRTRSSEIEKEKREMLLRVMTAKAQAGQLDDSTVDFLMDYLFLNFGKINETCEENYAQRLRAIRLIQNLPKARNWTVHLATYEISGQEFLARAYEEFVTKIAAIPNENIQAAGKGLRKKIERKKTLVKKRESHQKFIKHPASNDLKESDDIICYKLELAHEDLSGKSHSPTSDLSGWLPCSDGIDFIWGLKEIYLMKERNKLKRIYKSDERFFNIVNPCYDGKYVWAPVLTHDHPLVLVIDPVTEKIAEFTEKNGLPPMPTMIAAAALNPGKICLSGGLRGRGWCAILEISETGKRYVDVFHEARHNLIPSQATKQDVFNPNIAFYPRFMKVISDPNDKSKKRVIVGRSTYRRPLIINPETRSVEVMPDTMGTHLLDHYLTCHEGTLYWVELTGPEQRSNLCSISYDNLKKTAVVTGLPEDGLITFVDGAIHIVGNHWWTAKSLRGKFIQQKVKFLSGAWYYRKLCHSNHYGLVIISGKRAHNVEFQKDICK